MNLDNLYLKPTVKAEPLVNSWYAWPFLVYPVTFGMVTKNLHLRVLGSYLRAPKQHAKAVNEKALRGGLFVDHRGETADVERLVEFTRTELADLIALANDVHELSEWLAANADGGSLAEAYRRLPPSLQGRVELGYDLHNRAGLRFIERLFYRSAYYRPDLQSIELSALDGDRRPFALSSPRLGTPDSVNLAMPFEDERVDGLFAMRREPRSLDFVKSLPAWEEDDRKRKALMSLFTDRPPASSHTSVEPGRVRIRYFGHAAVLVETADVALLTDPIISYEQSAHPPRFAYGDLPEFVDYVLLTHNHQDHVLLETLLQLRFRIGTIVVPKSSGGTLQDMSLKIMLETLGFERVVELDELETIELPGGGVSGIPFLGEHGDLHIRSKLAYLVALGDFTALFAADSNNLDPQLYEHVREHCGKIDHIFIGMECSGAPQSWLYGPLFSSPLNNRHDQARRLDGSDCERALALIRSFDPKAVYVYAMGSEPWLTFISSIEYTSESRPIVESDALIAACRERGIDAERLYACKEIIVGSRA